jgi:hypothetical protein
MLPHPSRGLIPPALDPQRGTSFMLSGSRPDGSLITNHLFRHVIEYVIASTFVQPVMQMLL